VTSKISSSHHETPLSREEALQFKLIKRVLTKPPALLKDCEFRPVNSKEEFVACSQLVHNQYVKKNYMIPHKNHLRLSLHQATQKATPFIAVYKKKYILATLTLVEDSPLGIPMDKIYKNELNILRSKKVRLGEVGMLAQNIDLMEHPSLGFKKSDQMIVLLYLFRMMFMWVRSQKNLNVLVACFHPRHELFYKAMQFKSLAGLKSYESVEGNPALAYHLDIDKLEKTAEGTMRLAYGLDVSKEYINRRYKQFRFKLADFFEIFINLGRAA